MEVRFTAQELTLELRDKVPVLKGLANPVYDGQAGTEYELDEGIVERFAVGAFDEQLKQKDPDILALANHDSRDAFARTPDTLRVWSDKRGLWYEAEVTDERILSKVKLYRGSSIGFYPTEVQWIKDGNKDVRLIKRARLDHVSPVYRPAYLDTSAAIRELHANKDKEIMERYLARLQEIMTSMHT